MRHYCGDEFLYENAFLLFQRRCVYYVGPGPPLASEKLIADLLMTFFHNGAQVFQGNTTDVKELIEAQKHPEDYEHLIVRVGGFSARFVGLTPGLQTDIINRRRHNR